MSWRVSDLRARSLLGGHRVATPTASLVAVDGLLLRLQPFVTRVEEDDEDAGEEREESGQHQQRHWGTEA